MTLNYIIIGKHIKKARKKMKITQEKLAELLSFNIEYKNEVKDEFSSILENCSTYEKKIISDTARALKQSLRDERTSRTY